MKTPFLVFFTALLPLPLGAGVGVWTTSGPASPTIAAVAADLLHPGTLYAGGPESATGDSVFSSTDDGSSWTTLPLGRNIIALAVEAPAPVIRATDGRYLFSSTDGGAYWRSSLPSAWGTGFALAPTTPSTLLAGVSTATYCPLGRYCYDALVIVDSGGHSYAAPRGGLTALAFDSASPPAPVYAAAPGSFYQMHLGEWRQGSAVAGLAPVGVLAVDPVDANRVLAGTVGAGAYRTLDGGSTWTPAGGLPAGVSVRAIAFSPNSPGTIFLGTDAGVFRSADSGDSWAAMNGGLSNLDVTSLAIDVTGQFLHAGTNGGGVFDIELASPACADPHTLCLQGGRFQVSVQWTDFNGNSGFATVVPGASSTNSGVMWFFSPDNWELLIKVLDGCGVNHYHWVLGAAATNVGYTIQVTDTETGQVNTYANPLGTVSPAITDSTAFGGACP